MAGLYDGIEEIPFKKIDGGYVFQANNPWFIGPKQRYFVTEAQKLEVAACIRETTRRMKPFIFAAMVVIPLALVAGIFWLVFNSGTLNVTLTDANGKTTSYSQAIGSTGSSGTIAGPDGTSVLFHVSALPGKNTTITYSRVDASGKIGVPSTVAFASGSAKLNLTDSKGQVFNSTMFVSRIGGAPGRLGLETFLLTLALFLPYIGSMHIYSMRRLRPLITDLPRTDSRITVAENTRNFASKISVRLLVIIGIAAALGLISNAINLTEKLFENRPLESMETLLFGTAMSTFLVIYFAYLLFLRAKEKRHAS